MPSIKGQYGKSGGSAIKVIHKGIGWLQRNRMPPHQYPKKKRSRGKWNKEVTIKQNWQEKTTMSWKIFNKYCLITSYAGNLSLTLSFRMSLHPSIGPVFEKTSWRRGSVTCGCMFPTYLQFPMKNKSPINNQYTNTE